MSSPEFRGFNEDTQAKSEPKGTYSFGESEAKKVRHDFATMVHHKTQESSGHIENRQDPDLNFFNDDKGKSQQSLRISAQKGSQYFLDKDQSLTEAERINNMVDNLSQRLNFSKPSITQDSKESSFSTRSKDKKITTTENSRDFLKLKTADHEKGPLDQPSNLFKDRLQVMKDIMNSIDYKDPSTQNQNFKDQFSGKDVVRNMLGKASQLNAPSSSSLPIHKTALGSEASKMPAHE